MAESVPQCPHGYPGGVGVICALSLQEEAETSVGWEQVGASPSRALARALLSLRGRARPQVGLSGV